MSVLLSVSISEDLGRLTDALAASEGKSRSEVVRDALRQYLLDSRFRELQAYGQHRAEQAGIGPEDVERLIDEVRSEAG